MNKDWKKEVARDVLAIAGVPFFFIILIRALVGPYWTFVYHISIAGALIFIFWLFFKKANYYASRGIVLWVFSSLFYQEGIYTGFTLLILLGLFGSLFYIKTKKMEILSGLIAGAVASGLAYYIVGLI